LDEKRRFAWKAALWASALLHLLVLARPALEHVLAGTALERVVASPCR
jgi:hypothetical protein